MKFSTNLILAVLSGVLVFTPTEVLAVRGRPRRLDASYAADVEHRDIDPIPSYDELHARYGPGLDVEAGLSTWTRRGLTDLLHSTKKIDIRCTNCTPQERKQVVAFVQKKYNKDKNLNKARWTGMDVKIEGGTRIKIFGTVYMMEGGKKHLGATQIWLVDDMKEVH